MMRLWLIVGTAILIAIAVYTISPLFINKTVDEAVPENLAIEAYNKFESLNDEQRIQIASEMTEKEKNIIMIGGAKVDQEIKEDMPSSLVDMTENRQLSGNFVGVGDGIHDAHGVTKILTLSDGKKFLRFEDFRSTNGPDLRVYLATDKSASDFIDFGALKGNIGNQNYQLPPEADLSKYNNVLVWCRAFSVLFGHAQLT